MAIADTVIILAYSAMKNRAYFIAEYSVQNPETSSVSASGKSNPLPNNCLVTTNTFRDLFFGTIDSEELCYIFRELTELRVIEEEIKHRRSQEDVTKILSEANQKMKELRLNQNFHLFLHDIMDHSNSANRLFPNFNI